MKTINQFQTTYSIKKLYNTTLFVCMMVVSTLQSQTFDFSLSFIGVNGETNNYQVALIATPSAMVTNGITADMGAGFYLPSGLTIGNFAIGDSGIPASDWSSFSLGSNASGDGIFISRVELRATSTIINGTGPFQLVLFDILADPNPKTGSIALMENGDPLLVAKFIEDYMNINVGGGTVNAYNQNKLLGNAIDFSVLRMD